MKTKTVNDYLDEAKSDIKFFMNRNISGSSLYKSFTKSESDQVLKALHKHSRSEYELMDFLYSTDEENKYSESLAVYMNNISFSLYAANGIFRIGSGGAILSSSKILNDKFNFNEFVNLIPKAKIRN